jgi:hypothetical protein
MDYTIYYELTNGIPHGIEIKVIGKWKHASIEDVVTKCKTKYEGYTSKFLIFRDTNNQSDIDNVVSQLNITNNQVRKYDVNILDKDVKFVYTLNT